MMEKAMLAKYLQKENLEDIYKFDAADFKDEKCSKIFCELKKNKNVDWITIAKNTGLEIGEIAALSSSSNTNDRWYEEAYNNLASKKIFSFFINNPEATYEERMDVMIKYACRSGEAIPQPEEDITSSYVVELDRRATETTIDTGFKALDSLLYGLRRGELMSIGGRPGDGKSTMALDIAIQIAKQGQKVLFFTLEMSMFQIMDRRVLQRIDIPLEHLRNGTLTKEEWGLIMVVLDEFYKEETEGNLLFFHENNLDTIEMLVKTHKPFAIVIDQLEQLRAKRNFKDKRERFSHMTNNIKRMTMEHNICALLLAQLNRDAENKAPTLANLKESGSIEEDSDNVILLNRVNKDDVESTFDIGDSDYIHVNLAKHRNGMTKDFFLIFNKRRCRFENFAS